MVFVEPVMIDHKISAWNLTTGTKKRYCAFDDNFSSGLIAHVFYISSAVRKKANTVIDITCALLLWPSREQQMIGGPYAQSLLNNETSQMKN